MKPRLLFFDVLRIASVLAIILFHVAPMWGINARYLFGQLWYFHITFGYVGVWVLIFVSGAVLEYGCYKLDTIKDVLVFYWRRITKLYPAYWMAMLLAIFVTPSLLHELLSQPIMQLTGMSVILGTGEYVIFVGWFIGEILILYLLFPILSKLINKSPYVWTAILVGASLFSIWMIYNGIISRPDYNVFFYRYFPPCNIFAFALGIFIVKMGWYPKFTYTWETLGYFAELSFYAFLLHGVVQMMLSGRLLMFFTIESILVYFAALILMSSMLMLTDITMGEKMSGWYKTNLN